jgi:hypothetical protein
MTADAFDVAVALVDVGLIGLGIVAIGPTILGLFADGVAWIVRGAGRTVREIVWRRRVGAVDPVLWDELLALTLEHHAAQAEVDRIATAARRRIRRIAEAGDERRPGREVRR